MVQIYLLFKYQYIGITDQEKQTKKLPFHDGHEQNPSVSCDWFPAKAQETANLVLLFLLLLLLLLLMLLLLLLMLWLLLLLFPLLLLLLLLSLLYHPLPFSSLHPLALFVHQLVLVWHPELYEHVKVAQIDIGVLWRN